MATPSQKGVDICEACLLNDSSVPDIFNAVPVCRFKVGSFTCMRGLHSVFAFSGCRLSCLLFFLGAGALARASFRRASRARMKPNIPPLNGTCIGSRGPQGQATRAFTAMSEEKSRFEAAEQAHQKCKMAYSAPPRMLC